MMTSAEIAAAIAMIEDAAHNEPGSVALFARQLLRTFGLPSSDDPRCTDPECGESLAEIAAGRVGHCGRTCSEPRYPEDE